MHLERRVVKEEGEHPSFILNSFLLLLFCVHTKKELGRKRKGKEELEVTFNASGASERNSGEDIPTGTGV